MKTLSYIILSLFIALFVGSAIFTAASMKEIIDNQDKQKPNPVKTVQLKPLDIVLEPTPSEIALATVIQHSNPGQIIASKEPRNCDYSNSEGASFERGRDPDGNPICGFAYYNACPYSEAVSADDPMCYKVYGRP